MRHLRHRSTRRWVCACLTGVLVHGAAGAAARATISLRGDVVVDNGSLTLGDVATIASGDEGLAKQLRGVELGSAPKPDVEERLGRAAIVAAVHRSLRQTVDIDWEGSRWAVVRGAAAVGHSDTIVRAAQAALAAELSHRSLDAQLRPVEQSAPSDLPPGTLTFRIRPMGQLMLAPRMSVVVEVFRSSAMTRRLVVPFDVVAKRDVYFSRRDIAVGQRVRSEDLTVGKHDVASLSDTAMSTDGDERLWTAQRPIAAGTIIPRGALGASLALARGDLITLKMLSGSIAIETAAIAQQDGIAGQVVLVRPEGAKEALRARVVGDGIAVLESRP